MMDQKGTMERQEAMRQLGDLTGSIMATDSIDAVELNKHIAEYSRVLGSWLSGAKATGLADSSGGFAGLVLQVPAAEWRRLQGSEPSYYASVIVVANSDGTFAITKNRYGLNGMVQSLDQVMWLDGGRYVFKDAV